MKVPDLVIEASQAVFEWFARHESCLILEVHTVPPNCEATVKVRERDVPATVVVGLGQLRAQTLCSYFWATTSSVRKKSEQNINASPKCFAGARLCCRRRWPTNFERSWPDLNLSKEPNVSDTRFGVGPSSVCCTTSTSSA